MHKGQSKYSIDFFKELAKNNGGACFSTEYTNIRTRLKLKCARGHEWNTEARKLLEGSWCFECFCDSIRIPFDEDFFSRDTEESFYVAGFLAADGWKTGSKYKNYAIGISLAAKDIDILLKIKTAIKFEGELKYKERWTHPPNAKEPHLTKTYTLKFSSKKTFKDLERFNIVERKTYIYDMPSWLKIHPLLRHFLRGYIEGDGGFSIAQNKLATNPHIVFYMRGTANFLQSFEDVLARENIVDLSNKNRLPIEPVDGLKAPTFDRIYYGGNGICSKLYDYFYSGATIYMNRKEKIAQKSKEWAIIGTGKRRIRKRTALPFTAKILLEKAKELKSQKKVAEYFGCTSANISWATKNFNIRNEFKLALNN